MKIEQHVFMLGGENVFSWRLLQKTFFTAKSAKNAKEIQRRFKNVKLSRRLS